MNHDVAVVTGANMEADGSFSVELKAVGLEKHEAILLVDMLREAVRVFSELSGGGRIGTARCDAGSVDEALAVFESHDATKQ